MVDRDVAEAQRRKEAAETHRRNCLRAVKPAVSCIRLLGLEVNLGQEGLDSVQIGPAAIKLLLKLRHRSWETGWLSRLPETIGSYKCPQKVDETLDATWPLEGDEKPLGHTMRAQILGRSGPSDSLGKALGYFEIPICGLWAIDDEQELMSGPLECQRGTVRPPKAHLDSFSMKLRVRWDSVNEAPKEARRQKQETHRIEEDVDRLLDADGVYSNVRADLGMQEERIGTKDLLREENDNLRSIIAEQEERMNSMSQTSASQLNDTKKGGNQRRPPSAPGGRRNRGAPSEPEPRAPGRSRAQSSSRLQPCSNEAGRRSQTASRPQSGSRRVAPNSGRANSLGRSFSASRGIAVGRGFGPMTAEEVLTVLRARFKSPLEAFRAFDSDGDGMISPADFEFGISSVQMPAPVAHGVSDAIFRQVDVDGLGFLSMGRLGSLFGLFERV